MTGTSNLNRKPQPGQDPASIDYEEAVHEGQQLVRRMEGSQWRLGEIADRVEPRYGKQTLARLAEEIGVDGLTLERHRSVFRAWKDISAPGPDLSYSVMRELAAHPDRAQIVKDNPGITKREAREIVEAYRGPAAPMMLWQKRLLKLAREVIEQTEEQEWDASNLQPSLAPMVRRAANSLAEAANTLEKQQAEATTAVEKAA